MDTYDISTERQTHHIAAPSRVAAVAVAHYLDEVADALGVPWWGWADIERGVAGIHDECGDELPTVDIGDFQDASDWTAEHAVTEARADVAGGCWEHLRKALAR